MMGRVHKSKQSRRQRGFSLTELAIVLLLTGLVIGAVWVAAEKVWENYLFYRTTQQVTTTAQNIREYFMNANRLPMTGELTALMDYYHLFPEEMRGSLAGTCLPVPPLPAYGATNINHPYSSVRSFIFNKCEGWPGVLQSERDLFNNTPGTGASFGSLKVLARNGQTDRFSIVLTNLPASACIKLLVNGLPYADTSTGISALCAVGAPIGCYNEAIGNAGAVMPIVVNAVTGATTSAATGLPITLDYSTAAGLCNGAGRNNAVAWQFRIRN